MTARGSAGHWLTVVVRVRRSDAEVAADQLWAAGAPGVEVRDAGPDHVELVTTLGEDPDQVHAALTGLAWPWEFVEVDAGVADTWRQFATATEVAPDFVVYPAWQDPPQPPASIALAIEPGATFGLGNHPTTVASLRALRRALIVGDRVLDVGTGSGVLSVAAAVLGARHAHGVDITPASLHVVTDNARRNAVGERVTVSTEPLSALAEPYDVVVANILAPTLVELAPDLTRLCRRVLVLSGLLAGRTAHVEAAMAPWTVRSHEVVDGWVALTLER